MFSRKQFDNKKHPFRDKGSRRATPYKKEDIRTVLKSESVDIYRKPTEKQNESK